MARALDETKKDFGCASFTAGTPILIPGRSLRIEALLKGAYVDSRNEKTFENSEQLVTQLHTRKAEGYHHIQAELGDIKVTEEHPFWMQGKGWVKAKDLKRGDTVATINGDMLIYQNEYINKPVQVFNFTVDKTHNYFAGSMGAWVHNAGPECNIGVAKGIKTPYGTANQAADVASMAARDQVENGAMLYRIGTTGKSQAAEAQFWSLENPLSAGYAERYGIPESNVINANFIETATLKPSSPFVTRPAPRVGANSGGGIEVVVPECGVILRSFNYGSP